MRLLSLLRVRIHAMVPFDLHSNEAVDPIIVTEAWLPLTQQTKKNKTKKRATLSILSTGTRKHDYRAEKRYLNKIGTTLDLFSRILGDFENPENKRYSGEQIQ